MKSLIAGLMGAVLLVASGSPNVEAALLYDAAGGFSVTNHPDGRWQYGYRDELLDPCAPATQTLDYHVRYLAMREDAFGECSTKEMLPFGSSQPLVMKNRSRHHR
jgi:hypothetical protein